MKSYNLSGTVKLFFFSSTFFIFFGCSGTYVAVSPSLDAGTFEVSGLESGVGGKLEVGYHRPEESPSWGLAWTSGWHGYSSPGDGDPIFISQVIYLRSQTFSDRLGFQYGGGIGGTATAGSLKPMVPLRLGIDYGFTGNASSPFLGLYSNFGPVIGGGSPSVDAYISVQMALGYRF